MLYWTRPGVARSHCTVPPGDGGKGCRSLRRKRKISLALAVVAGAIVYLIATAVSQTTMYYLTVGEALARQDRLVGQWMRVSGQVPGDSIEWDPALFRLSFRVEADGHSLPAVYYGVRPDSLIDGSTVILEGSFHEDGYFDVQRLLVQCVSKYEAVDDYDYGDGAQKPRLEEIGGQTYEAYEGGSIPRRR